jgi:hypothetical protein
MQCAHTARGIMPIAMAGFGTGLLGIDGAELTILLLKDLKRRQLLQTRAAISTALFCPAHLDAQILRAGNNVGLRCLGNIPRPLQDAADL